MLNRKMFKGRMDECRNLLKNQEEWCKLPLFNCTPNHLLQEGQLVRFQCMVQDMFSPVLFISEYEVKNINTGITEVRKDEYCNTLDVADDEMVIFDSERTISKDKKLYFCISVPGVNEWVDEIHTSQQVNIIEQLKQAATDSSSSPLSQTNRKRCMCVVENTTGQPSDVPHCSAEFRCKRHCTNERVAENKDDSSVDTRQKNFKSYFPISTSKEVACLLNVYDDVEFRLNEVLDVVGFLSYDLTGNGLYTEVVAGIPPQGAVPCINAVTINKIRHSNPLVLPSFDSDEFVKSAENIRAELSSVLEKLFFGDSLCADYLICYLLSTVFNRQSGLVLGKFSLNISNIPQDCDFAENLYTVILNLVPKSHYLPLTIDNLNTMTFIPKKDYETNRLESGMLQLSGNTFLVLDETKLEPGKLQNKGVKNVQALSNIISQQEIGYDFQYYPIDFTTDIPVLTISEGKSMLPSDFHVVLDHNNSHSPEFVKELFNEAIRYMKNSGIINNIRIYLSVMASLAYKFSKDLEAQIAEDFVRMRQNIGKTSSQDLHDLLVIARLFSLSRGSTSLTMQTWEIVQEMERQRKARLST